MMPSRTASYYFRLSTCPKSLLASPHALTGRNAFQVPRLLYSTAYKCALVLANTSRLTIFLTAIKVGQHLYSKRITRRALKWTCHNYTKHVVVVATNHDCSISLYVLQNTIFVLIQLLFEKLCIY